MKKLKKIAGSLFRFLENNFNEGNRYVWMNFSKDTFSVQYTDSAV